MEAATRRAAAHCAFAIPDRATFDVSGWFVARGAEGRGTVPFLAVAGLPGDCRVEVRAVPPPGVGGVEPGAVGRWRGEWRVGAAPDPGRPSSAGFLILGSARANEGAEAPTPGPADRIHAAAQRSIERNFGVRAGLVDALILARKDRVDAEIRDAFARAGLAHLLAISGFHVGVVASLVFGLARVAGAGRERAVLVAGVTVWAYVLLIGAPDAAVRAATVLSLAGLTVAVRRRPHAVGMLAVAALVILVVDPTALTRVGFQLSYAGAAGLALLARPISRLLVRVPVLRRRALGHLRDGVAAGTAATVMTMPLVAWHFGTAPVYGVLSTLVAAPLVAAALPGILAVLALDPLLPGLARFLAGGVVTYLDLLLALASATAELPGAAPWVSRGAVVWTVAGALMGATLGHLLGVRGTPRRMLPAFGAAYGFLLAPLVGGGLAGGGLLIAAVDVGQGDAIAIRTPEARWILVDAGRAFGGWDAGERDVLPYLRGRGARRLELLVLTHPDLDHIGGAGSVLRGLEVGRVLDPGIPSPSSPYTDLLKLADSLGTPWSAAGRTPRIRIDGVSLTVLHPPDPALIDPFEPLSANETSVVMLLEWDGFRALLTGDASVEVERAVLDRVGAIDLLKVGHHGSATSTSAELLGRTRPAVAIIPVGARNSYGHPEPGVLRRLREAGVAVHRTDLEGTLEVRVGRGGGWTVRSGWR